MWLERMRCRVIGTVKLVSATSRAVGPDCHSAEPVLIFSAPGMALTQVSQSTVAWRDKFTIRLPATDQMPSSPRIRNAHAIIDSNWTRCSDVVSAGSYPREAMVAPAMAVMEAFLQPIALPSQS